MITINTPVNAAILPSDPQEAVRLMIDITERLSELMADESEAISYTDKNLFVDANEEKQKLASMYEKAAEEFHKRIAEFKGVDSDLIDHLDREQKKLGDRAQANMISLENAAIKNS